MPGAGAGVSNKVGSPKMGHLALLYSGPSNTNVTLNGYWEGTLSLSVPGGPNAEFRVEGRYDRSIDASVFKGGTEQGQSTLQVAALAWF